MERVKRGVENYQDIEGMDKMTVVDAVTKEVDLIGYRTAP
jgi:hypothetical protein